MRGSEGEGGQDLGLGEGRCMKEVSEAVRPIFQQIAAGGRSRLYDEEILEEECDTSSADEQITCLTTEEAEKSRCEDLFVQVLKSLGEDVRRQGILKTPTRYAKAVSEMLSGYKKTAEEVLGDAVFHEECVYGKKQVVCVGSIDFYSTDMRTLLPFFGEVHISYLPAGGNVAGLSKFARITEVFSKRLQTPEKLAGDIASSIEGLLAPLGVLVVVNCVHLKESSLEGLGPSSSNLDAGSFQAGGGGKMNTHVEARGAFLDQKGKEAKEILGLIDFASFGAGGRDDGGSVARCFNGVLDNVLSMKEKEEYREREHSVKNLIYRMHAQAPHLSGGCRECTPVSADMLWSASDKYASWLMMMTSGSHFSTEYVLHVVRTMQQDRNGECEVEDPDTVFRRGRMSNGKDGHTCELYTSVGTVCEHHILPFFGKVYISLLQNGGRAEVTREELSAIVWKHSRQLQLQERLGTQIADDIEKFFPLLDGVFVCMSAYHHCMRARGAEKTSAKTLSVIKRGFYEENEAAAMDAVQKYRGIVSKNHNE